MVSEHVRRTPTTPITRTSTSIAPPPKQTLKLLSVGGSQGKYLLSDVELIDPMKEDSSCSDTQNLPQKTEGMIGALFQNFPIVCGGNVEGSGISNKCFQHYSTSNTWEEFYSHLLLRREYATAIKIQNKIWISGGDGKNSTSLISSELLSDEGTFTMTTSNLPEKMLDHCVSTINDTHIFIAGTSKGNPRSAYIVNIDIQPFIFTKLPDMLKERFGAGCATLIHNSSSAQYKLIVAGGGYEKKAKKSTEVYSTEDGRWSEGPSLPRGFNSGGYVSTKNYALILIAGWDENMNDRSDIMAYDINSNAFQFLPGKFKIRKYGLAVIAMETEEVC